MLDWLEIKDFAIAEHVALDFEDGFTVVTGETGSGKSIMVDAVSLLLGQRFDKVMIRYDQPQAELQASFDISNRTTISQWLLENDLQRDDSCIIRRVLRHDKPSKNYINGIAVMVSQLKQLGQMLVDIHGQNEHHSLLNKNIQQELLDEVSGNHKLLKELSHHCQNIKEINQKIEQINSQQKNHQERIDLLTFQLEELSELTPLENEWQELDAKHKRLNHLQDISIGIEKIVTTITNSEQTSVDQALSTCIHELQQLMQFEPQLTSICQMLTEAQVNIQEASIQLKQLADSNNLDPEEIQAITQRFSLYHQLARKHRVEPDNLFNHYQQLTAELDSARNPEQDLTNLESLLQQHTKNYHRVADTISANRKSTAIKLNKEITDTIHELGMPKGIFEIALHDKEEVISRTGKESIEFLATANPGQPPQSLSKAVSGGELSRLSLAIQVTLASKNQTPTLIFDEVDVGIGGKTADIVGQKLKLLGVTAQVICVTHLAQVAAKGEHHYSVVKTNDNSTDTQTNKLNKQQRIEEIARMSGGVDITKESLAHAEKMLNQA